MDREYMSTVMALHTREIGNTTIRMEEEYLHLLRRIDSRENS